MKIKSNILFKSSSIYIVSNLINSIVPFVLLPYLTSKLAPSGYALISLISLSISFFLPFIGFSTYGALLKRFYENENYNYKSYLSNCFYVLLSSIIFFLIIIYCFDNLISSFFLIPKKTIVYILVICSSNFVHQLLLTTWRVNNKPYKYALFQVSLTFLNLILTYILISYYNLDWEGRILAWMYSNLFFGVISIIYLWYKSYIFKSINTKYIKDAINFSLPLIPHAIGSILIGVFSRLIVGKTLGIEEVGIFSVSYQFATVLGVVFAAFNTAFVPWLFNKLKTESVNTSYLVQISYKLMILFISGTILSYYVILFSFQYIVDSKFSESKDHIFILLLSFMFNGFYYLVTNYIFYKNQTKYLGYSTGIISLIHLPLCYFLTLYFGLKGTTISIMISYAVLFISTWIISNKIYPMPWLNEFKLIFNKNKHV